MEEDMPIDMSKPRTQYRINVCCGPGHPEWSTKRHLFMTRWQDFTEAEAKEWFNLIKKHFPEKHHWEVTAQIRIKHPRSQIEDAPWMPWVQFRQQFERKREHVCKGER
jgi:hypothetical protein